MTRTNLNWLIAIVASFRTIASWVVVMQGATDEPYFEYHYSDAFSQVVLGSSLIAVWCCISLVLIPLVIIRLISAKWLFLVLWSVICIFYLSSCPLGYLSDLEHNILRIGDIQS
jgi:hypothetical protein